MKFYKGNLNIEEGHKNLNTILNSEYMKDYLMKGGEIQAIFLRGIFNSFKKGSDLYLRELITPLEGIFSFLKANPSDLRELSLKVKPCEKIRKNFKLDEKNTGRYVTTDLKIGLKNKDWKDPGEKYGLSICASSNLYCHDSKENFGEEKMWEYRERYMKWAQDVSQKFKEILPKYSKGIKVNDHK